MKAEMKRNFALVGHAQTGKTSLSESILFNCGITSRKGAVMDGTTLSDYSPDEIERKISINASTLSCNYKEHQIQFIDTPGYADFIGEAIASLRAVDSAVVLVDASAGVEVGTERIWEVLDEQNLPRVIFVNKIDKEDVDLGEIITEIKNVFSKKVVKVESLADSDLIESVAETDDQLLEKYLESGSLSEDEVKTTLRQAIVTGKIFPLICGSALNDKGVKELLNIIVEYLPSPLEHSALKVTNIKTQEEKTISPKEDGVFSAFVFKTISDPYVGQLTILRVFSGSLASNTAIYNVNESLRERIGQIYILQGKEQKPIETASCGDIVAIAKLKDAATCDSLGDAKDPCVFEAIAFPEPAISSSVKPKSRQDEEKISASLSKLSAEDPTFKVTRDNQTKELIISGVGDLHLAIMIGRMKHRFKVEVELGKPKVAYKETITKSAKIQGKYKKQSGGRGQYGDAWVEVEPLTDGSDFEFVDKIFGGAIPRNFIPSVEKGVKQAMSEGVLAGCQIVNIKVILFDGSYHAVDSSDMAFQIAGAMALRKAVLAAGPALLEPVMDVEVVVSDEYMGQISGDLNSRRGRIMGMDSKGKNQVVKAQVPLAEMFTYATDLRSITGGRGSYTMRFSHYEQVPQKIAANIIAQYQAQKKGEG